MRGATIVSKDFWKLLGAALLIGFLAGCQGEGEDADEAETTNEPEQPLAQKKHDIAHVKVGETYVFKNRAGGEMRWVVTRKERDHVLYRMDMFMNDQLHKGGEPVRWPSKDGEKEPTGEVKEHPSETLVVGKLKYKCTVTEIQTESGKPHKRWISNKFPGLIKTELGGVLSQKLSRIDPPKD